MFQIKVRFFHYPVCFKSEVFINRNVIGIMGFQRNQHLVFSGRNLSLHPSEVLPAHDAGVRGLPQGRSHGDVLSGEADQSSLSSGSLCPE